jgi:ketosteroid isomerase-like protein
MKPLSLLLICLTLLFTACESGNTNTAEADEAKRDTVDHKAVIEETNKAFSAAALKGDSAAFVTTLYHPDAAVFPPNAPEMNVSKTASAMTQFSSMGVTSFSLTTKEIFKGDETVTEVGTYEMGDGSKTIDKGKYMVVWKKDGDTWKLFRDIWNSDNPYSPPPPASKK